MKEIDLQKLICDAVNERGGFAFKMSHRFLVGVPDLFVQPYFSARPFFLEVKHRTSWPKEDFKLDVTKLQDQFLRRAHSAGMDCGVASFIKTRGSLYFGVFSLDEMIDTGYTARVSNHHTLARFRKIQKPAIYRLLCQQEWK